MSNGLSFLTKKSRVRREQRRDKTPTTKNDPKLVWAQPPFSALGNRKLAVGAPGSTAPVWFDAVYQRKVSSQPGDKPLSLPLAQARDFWRNERGVGDLALGGSN